MPTRAKQMIDTLKLAWAAGFTDGEGYIGLTRWFDKQRGYHTYRVQFEVAQVHKLPIELMSSMFPGIGRVRHYENKKRGYWTWRVFGQDAIEVIKVLLPYLVMKQEQARLVLEYEFTDRRIDGKGRWRKAPLEVRERRAALFAAICELNGGRALQAERLNEEAPLPEGDAIVRSHGNDNHESATEMVAPPKLHKVG
jgi:hypothetical protein